MDLSDRIVVLSEGRIAGEFAGSTADRAQLGLLMGGRATATAQAVSS